jgi:hypothetical protein
MNQFDANGRIVQVILAYKFRFRTQDGEFRVPQRKDIPNFRVLYIHIVAADLFHYLLVGHGIIGYLRHDHRLYFKVLQDIIPSSDVVCVRMAEKKVIQFPDPLLLKIGNHPLSLVIIAYIHHHVLSACLDQRAVSLPYIQKRDFHLAFGGRICNLRLAQHASHIVQACISRGNQRGCNHECHDFFNVLHIFTPLFCLVSPNMYQSFLSSLSSEHLRNSMKAKIMEITVSTAQSSLRLPTAKAESILLSARDLYSSDPIIVLCQFLQFSTI